MKAVLNFYDESDSLIASVQEDGRLTPSTVLFNIRHGFLKVSPTWRYFTAYLRGRLQTIQNPGWTQEVSV